MVLTNSSRITSFGYAFLSTALLATVPIVSKLGLEVLSVETFVPLWYLLGSLFALAHLVRAGQLKKVISYKPFWLPILMIGVVESIGVMAFFVQVKLINPALVSFFANLRIIYMVLWGLIFLKERLNPLEVVGMLMVILGASLITYKSGRVVLLAFLLAIFVNNPFLALGKLIAKVKLGRVDSMSLAGFRSFLIFLFTSAYAVILARDKLQVPSGNNWAMISLGGFLGPFLANALLYRALSRINLSEIGVIGGTLPLFVTLYAFLLFRAIPRPYQMIGGLLTIIGVFVLCLGRRELLNESLAGMASPHRETGNR